MSELGALSIDRARVLVVRAALDAGNRHSFLDDYAAREVQLDGWVYDAIPALSRKTLFRWIKSYEANAAVADKRIAANRARRKLTAAGQRIVLGVLAEHPHALAKHVHAVLASKGVDVSVDTVERHLRQVRAGQAWAHLANPDAWKSRYLAAFGSADQVERLNQLWEIDTTPADVMLIDGRHCIVGLIDVYARRARLVVAKTSKAEAACATLRRGIIDWGVCDALRHDNGKDYKSKRVQSALGWLEIRPIVCEPFKSEQKPFVERFFRTFSLSLEMKPGFIGHSVVERQAIEARKSFAERIMEPGAVVEVSMTAADLQAWCDQWIAVYERTPHEGLDGRTPAEVVGAWREPVRRVDERALDVLLSEGVERSVGKKGLRHEGALFIAPDLAPQIGERVIVRVDPIDLGRVYVFDGEHRFLCVAECPERTGIDRRAVALEAKKRQREAMKTARRAAREARRELGIDDIAQAVLEHQRSQTAPVVPLPAPSAPHTNAAIEGALAAAAVPSAERPAAAEVVPIASRIRQRELEAEDERWNETQWQRYRALRGRPRAELGAPDREWMSHYETTPECSSRLLLERFTTKEKAPVADQATGAMEHHR